MSQDTSDEVTMCTLARALDLISLLSGAPQIVRIRRNHDERRPAALRLSAGPPKVTIRRIRQLSRGKVVWRGQTRRFWYLCGIY
eukprot:scaffold32289_cov42-Phaeocystis_antarctica.AAC.1